MKYFKRLKKYKANNVTFDPETCEAYSYAWWRFVARIEGKVVFNNYFYSISTNRHQWKVKKLLNDLDIKIDIEAPFPKGIPYLSLAEIIEIAEINLCDQILEKKIKQQESNERNRFMRFKKRLEDYLENEVHFRDYEIVESHRFGLINKASTVNQIVDRDSLQKDVQDAMDTFHRDGYGSIIFYLTY